MFICSMQNKHITICVLRCNLVPRLGCGLVEAGSALKHIMEIASALLCLNYYAN